jgi:hypothetical protein
LTASQDSVPAVTLISATQSLTPDQLIATVYQAALRVTPSPTPSTPVTPTAVTRHGARKPGASATPHATATR